MEKCRNCGTSQCDLTKGQSHELPVRCEVKERYACENNEENKVKKPIGRPPTNKKKANFHIDPEVHDDFKLHCQINKCDMSEIIEDLVKEYLKKVDAYSLIYRLKNR